MGKVNKAAYQKRGPAEGRDDKGRFGPGNPHRFPEGHAGGGNSLAGYQAKLRRAFYERVSVEDFGEIVDKVVELAKKGDIRCAEEIFSRALGKPVEADLLQRMELLEQLVKSASGGGVSEN